MGLLKAAVIGVGAMGRHHARVYASLPTTELVAVVDQDRSTAERVASLYQARSYTDYHDMLAWVRPDIVSVAVPTMLHYTAVLSALQRGCHVLVEKPITATEVEAVVLISEAQRRDLCLMVGHIVRFDPAIQLLRARIKARQLGAIQLITCRRLGPSPQRVRDVGAVLDLAIHDADIIQYLVEQPVIRVVAETFQRPDSEFEDAVFGMLVFDGTLGMVNVNWLTPMKIREVMVVGERGMARVDCLTQDLYFHEGVGTFTEYWDTMQLLRGVGEGRITRYPIQKIEPLKLEIMAFVQSVVEDRPPPVTGHDGLMALRLAQGFLESAQTQQSVSF